MNREPDQILDELTILQSQDGDAESVARLVKIWHPRFVRYAMKIVGEYESAVDAVQESWIAILKGLKRGDDPAKFRSWAFRIVHNKSFDSIRRKIKRKTVIEEVSKQLPSSFDSRRAPSIDASEDVSLRLRHAIEQLKPKDQMVLSLYYEESLSIKEIEVVTGLTTSSIKSRLDRLRKKLKSILERNKDE